MVGAGQLARMAHQAAVDLGVEMTVLAGSARDSAVLAGAPHVLGSPSKLTDLLAVAKGADVVTFDHELAPNASLVELERSGYRLQPGPHALAFAQDKIAARVALSGAGLPVPPFVPVASVQDVERFSERHGWPLVVKSARGGYDGRGVHVVGDAAEAGRLLARPGPPEREWLAEALVDLEAELTILLARTSGGQVAVYPAVQTIQREGVLRHLLMPAPLPGDVVRRAGDMAVSIAETIGATGIVAVEMFLDTTGQLSVNELALRPHNSGHATIEACETSQFHQHLRAVLGWPLGLTALRSPAATVNVIGEADVVDPAGRLATALAVPGVHVHLYGKTPRAGRKLGHVTALGSDAREALERAGAATALLTRR